jgi:Protein of unknown function (DUF3102)
MLVRTAPGPGQELEEIVPADKPSTGVEVRGWRDAPQAPELRIPQEQDVSADRLEAIAKEIETLQANTILHVAQRLAEARDIFKYRRDEGGFGGWVECRLRYSRDRAYNLLHVHERFGGQSVELFDAFAPTVLYLLAKPSTPESARGEVLDRAAAGKSVSVAEAREVVRKHKPPPPLSINKSTKNKRSGGIKSDSDAEASANAQDAAIERELVVTCFEALAVLIAASEKFPDAVNAFNELPIDYRPPGSLAAVNQLLKWLVALRDGWQCNNAGKRVAARYPVKPATPSRSDIAAEPLASNDPGPVPTNSDDLDIPTFLKREPAEPTTKH